MLLGLIIVIVILFLWFFNRGPAKFTNRDASSVYSPSFGKVLDVLHSEDTITVCVFLGLEDIHKQYFPVSGIITEIISDSNGKYEIATSETKSRDNTKVIHTLLTPSGDTIKIYQIAGMLVRRITCSSKAGDEVYSGQYLGAIKLGSRVDIEYPRKFGCSAKKGDVVTPNTVFAKVV